MIFFPFFAILVSVVYFYASPKSQKLSQRLIVSSHGLSIAAIFAFAMIFHWLGYSDSRYALPFIFLLVLPVALIGNSLFKFRGPVSIHFFQIINLLCLFYSFFIGGMAATGDWL